MLPSSDPGPARSAATTPSAARMGQDRGTVRNRDRADPGPRPFRIGTVTLSSCKAHPFIPARQKLSSESSRNETAWTRHTGSLISDEPSRDPKLGSLALSMRHGVAVTRMNGRLTSLRRVLAPFRTRAGLVVGGVGLDLLLGIVLGRLAFPIHDEAPAPLVLPSAASVGAAEVAMPDLGGLTTEQSRRVLVDAGLERAKVTTRSVEYAGPEGLVVGQQPIPGANVGHDSVDGVTLTLSRPGLIPDLSGNVRVRGAHCAGDARGLGHDRTSRRLRRGRGHDHRDRPCRRQTSRHQRHASRHRR